MNCYKNQPAQGFQNVRRDAAPKPPLLVHRSDIDSIFDWPFSYEDPRLRDLYWDELESGNVLGLIVELPENNLPDPLLFSGRTMEHQRLCSQVAAWMSADGRGYSAAAKDLGYDGGLADVVSADGNLFAECGYTRVSKVLHGLHSGLEILVASYNFAPVLFRRTGVMHFERYLKDLEEGARAAVERVPIALRYEDALK